MRKGSMIVRNFTRSVFSVPSGLERVSSEEHKPDNDPEGRPEPVARRDRIEKRQPEKEQKDRGIGPESKTFHLESPLTLPGEWGARVAIAVGYFPLRVRGKSGVTVARALQSGWRTPAQRRC